MEHRPRIRRTGPAIGVLILLASVLGCEPLDSGSNGGGLGSEGTAGTSGSGGSSGGAGGTTDPGATGGAAGAGGVIHVPIPEVVELDPTFGDDGIRIFSILNSSWTSEGARAVAVMPDDRIVVAGTKHLSSFGPSYGFATRFGDDGALDASFGEDGDGVVHAIFDDNTEISAVAIDSEDRILLGGWSKSASPSDPGALTLARYSADGILDDSFGNDLDPMGVTRLSDPCTVETTDIAVQSDGSIVATGSACESTERISVVRVLPDGTADAAFGDDGVLLMDPGYSTEVLISSDAPGSARILVGGNVGETGFDGNLDIAMASVSDDGSLDTGFGTDGMVVTDFGDGSPGRSEGLEALALGTDGRILAAGWAQTLPYVGEPFVYAYDFLIAAYDEWGGLDESFGNGGSTFIDFGSESEEAVEVLGRSNGNIVVVGRTLPNADRRKIAIAHLSADGAPADGEDKTLTGIEGAGLTTRGATLDNHGRLLVVGYVKYEGGGIDMFVARYVFRALE
ncbi:MAG: hypothetical protein KJO18_00785 [Acidimicrobiia bacterium]|nr:hypothetical protein [Acidimicrobiia bacterium]